MSTATTEVSTIGISGMTCGSCQRRVQHALRGVAGVTEASVDLVRGTATVRFDPSRLRSGALAEAVRAAGYEVVPLGAAKPDRARGGCCS